MKIPQRQPEIKPKTRQEMIDERLNQMPGNCRNVYLKAVNRKSMAGAVKAFCQECMGWSDYQAEIHNCTDLGCPLWRYRPYQKHKITPPSAVESTNGTEGGKMPRPDPFES
jgi:hypothetical protein